MNKFNAFLMVLLAVLILLAGGTIYTVDETQQVVLTQFGELIGQPIKAPGLYFKIPFIQMANYFDKRLLQWDGDPNQIPTVEKRFIWVDVTARWRISDPLKFMQSVHTEGLAQSRLDDIIDASTRDIISSNKLVEAIRNSNRILKSKEAMIKSDDQFGQTALESIQFGREELNKKIWERARPAMPEYGIELVDVRIKRIIYVEDVRRKVYERMISERKREAERYRSEGQGKKAEIEGLMRKDLNEIQSEAYRQAQEIKGEADAKATAIYAKAFNNDPEFYSFMQTLDTYRQTIGESTVLMLSTDNDYFTYLKGVGIKP